MIAAGIGALSMLMSEPTAKKLCKEDMYVFPLNRDIYIYLHLYSHPLPFYIPFLTEKVPLSYTFYLKNGTPFTYLV